MFPHSMITSSEWCVTGGSALRVSRITAFILCLTSVPMKWCSLAYMCDTAVSLRSSQNWRHAGKLVRKFSPTLRHQMRFRRSTSASRTRCSSKNPLSKF